MLLGTLAGLADVAGGLVLVRARGVERYLRYFVALGAGFLMGHVIMMQRDAPLRFRYSPRISLSMSRVLPTRAAIAATVGPVIRGTSCSVSGFAKTR